jgi:uncharacterized protein DUF5655
LAAPGHRASPGARAGQNSNKIHAARVLGCPHGTDAGRDDERGQRVAVGAHRPALRPIYDRLAAAIEDFGDDVSVEGRGSYTPFVRGRQFAAVAAATRDRVDLGLRFTDPSAAERLQPASGPGQATHKIALRSVGDVDDQVLHLRRLAYEQNP